MGTTQKICPQKYPAFTSNLPPQTMMGTTFHGLQVEGLVVQESPTAVVDEASWKKGVKEESIESEPTSVLDHSCSSSPPNSANGVYSSSMEDVGSMCCFGGEGSFLPWLMSGGDDPSLHVKGLLQSGVQSLDYNDSGGLGSVIYNYGVGKENVELGYGGSGSNCSNVKFHGEQFGVSDENEKPQVVDPGFGYGEGGQIVQNSGCYVPSFGFSQQEWSFGADVQESCYGGDVLDPGVAQVPKELLLSEDHAVLLRKQEQQFQMQQEQLLMSLAPQVVSQYPQGTVELKQQNSQVSALHDQLIKVAEMFQTGNYSLAQVILARLNQQVSLPGKPLVRAAALYVKEELEKLLTGNNMPAAPAPPKSLGAYDVVHKMNAFKIFSEVSPVMQFVDFTCTQALLEALDGAETIHILDFDIGCGSMWASFIRELSLRKQGAPLLKITVFASTSSHHPFELALICDNVLEFATEVGVSVDLRVMNLDLFDSASCTFPSFQLTGHEAVAVNFPIWACSHSPFLLPPLLSFIKRCSPKLVMTFDKGADCCDLAFPSHILHGLDSGTNLLDSLVGSSVPLEIVNKVEKFLIQPYIERIILGRIRAPDKMQAKKMQHSKSLLSSAGFIPLAFSDFTECQAHQVVNRIPVRGFHIENQQASLVLRWQSHVLVSASAWRC